MTHYDARFYTNKGVEIFNKKIECTPPSIPGMLACIVMDYLKDVPYPGTIKAHVIDGRCNMGYMLLLDNDAVDVYRHVEKTTRGGSVGTSPASANSKELPNKEESA